MQCHVGISSGASRSEFRHRHFGCVGRGPVSSKICLIVRGETSSTVGTMHGRLIPTSRGTPCLYLSPSSPLRNHVAAALIACRSAALREHVVGSRSVRAGAALRWAGLAL